MNKITSYIFLLLFFQQLNAQDSTSFSLLAAKEYALANHLSIKNAALNVDYAHQQYIETRGIGLPQVELNGNFQNFINLPVQVVDASFINPNASPGETIEFKAGTDYSSSGTIQVSQLIFNGSYIVGLQVSHFYEDFQQNVSLQSTEDVVFNVIQAYQLSSVAKKNKELADSIVEITQKLVSKQQHYLDLEMMIQEEMDQLNYSLLMSKNVQTSAEIQYQNALLMLKLAMGYPMESSISISETPEQLMKESNLPSGEIQNNLSYSILNQQIKLSEYNLKNQKAAYLPTLSTFFQHTYNAYRNEFNFLANEKWYPQTVWGLQLNIPVFSGGQRYARISQATIKLIQDQNSLTLLEEKLIFDEARLRNNYSGALNNFELQKQNIKLTETIYKNAVIKEKIGSGNSIVVSQKQNQLMQAQSQYIASLISLFQAKLELEKLYNNLLSNN